MSTAIIHLDDLNIVTVWPESDRSLIIMEIDFGDNTDVLSMTVETVDALILALAAARVAIKPPTTSAKSARNPRQPNVPDNADALARVAKSKPERIDGDEK